MEQMKIAVALACIANKPSDCSGEEYAKRLYLQYQKHQRDCRERLDQAQSQILHLQQELVLKSLESNDTDGAIVADIFPTPPLTDSHITFNPTHTLSKHAQFLQSVLNLKGVSSSDLSFTLKDTVLNSLSVITDCVKNGTALPTMLMRDCLQHISKLFYDKQLGTCGKIQHAVQQMAQGIVQALSQSMEHLKREDKYRILSSCSVISNVFLMDSVVQFILDKIESFCQHLQQVSKGEQCLDTDTYENIYYLLNLIEMALSQFHEVKDNKQQGILKLLQSRLEQAVLHVSEDFPLYAHAIWKIQTLVDAIYRTCNTSDENV